MNPKLSANNPMAHEDLSLLYQQHKSWLSLFVQRRLNCPHTTADLVQDTYLRVLSRGESSSVEYSRRYLTHIAKGLVTDLFRRRRVEQGYLEYLQLQPQATQPSAETCALMIEGLIAIDALLQRLPHKAKQAFLLRQLEGYSYKKIASTMGVSLSSVEKYIARAIQACLIAIQED